MLTIWLILVCLQIAACTTLKIMFKSRPIGVGTMKACIGRALRAESFLEAKWILHNILAACTTWSNTYIRSLVSINERSSICSYSRQSWPQLIWWRLWSRNESLIVNDISISLGSKHIVSWTKRLVLSACRITLKTLCEIRHYLHHRMKLFINILDIY